MFLRPKNDALNINGKLSYSESSQAWSVMRFKKVLINEFPQLKEKSSFFGYKLFFYNSYEGLEKTIKLIKENKQALPILMFFYKL